MIGPRAPDFDRTGIFLDIVTYEDILFLIVLFGIEYFRKENADYYDNQRFIQVIPLRFERRTHALEGRCSIQLSYGTILICECKGSAFYETTKKNWHFFMYVSRLFHLKNRRILKIRLILWKKSGKFAHSDAEAPLSVFLFHRYFPFKTQTKLDNSLIINFSFISLCQDVKRK